MRSQESANDDLILSLSLSIPALRGNEYVFVSLFASMFSVVTCRCCNAVFYQFARGCIHDS